MIGTFILGSQLALYQLTFVTQKTDPHTKEAYRKIIHKRTMPSH